MDEKDLAPVQKAMRILKLSMEILNLKMLLFHMMESVTF